MKNEKRRQAIQIAGSSNGHGRCVVSVMKIMAVLCVLLLAPAFAAAEQERFTIDFADSHIKGFRGEEATLYLKKNLHDQYPWLDLSQLDLKKVILVAKTRHGHGSASLRVGRWATDLYQVAGNPRGFRDSDRRSFDKLHLYNPSYGSRGPWQINLRGNFVVRKVVVVVDRHPSKKHHRPQHWYGHRW